LPCKRRFQSIQYINQLSTLINRELHKGNPSTLGAMKNPTDQGTLIVGVDTLLTECQGNLYRRANRIINLRRRWVSLSQPGQSAPPRKGAFLPIALHIKMNKVNPAATLNNSP
jgi:hypothetical protein